MGVAERPLKLFCWYCLFFAAYSRDVVVMGTAKNSQHIAKQVRNLLRFTLLCFAPQGKLQ